ncbi:unnamed protein product [Paramecium sonneborni]|uniref:Transmembrane protein n=1 Tax=Paramecium sonneborni TaxID=65129 RepID=A0A8S1PV25_9CILI|nr:unnamed protein product [Paramecium sonneborni]
MQTMIKNQQNDGTGFDNEFFDFSIKSLFWNKQMKSLIFIWLLSNYYYLLYIFRLMLNYYNKK